MRLTTCFLMLLIAIGGALAWISYPVELAFLNQLPEICPLKRWTGLKCAFCGMTHAWIAILHGRWSEATSFNLLSIPIFAVAGVVWIKPRPFTTRTFAWIALVVLVTYALIRNLI